MPAKTKKTQPKNDTSGRDNFQTPLYALDLIMPFVPKEAKVVLEPCAGQMRLVDRLKGTYGYSVHASDLYPQRADCHGKNFLDYGEDDLNSPLGRIDVSVSNPPFSLKFEFITKSLQLDIPFAYLIPFDMCGFLHRHFMSHTLGAIIPSRRIDYLTPNMVQRAGDGETLRAINLAQKSKYKKLSEVPPMFITKKMTVKYSSVDEMPYAVIKRYSSSDFHSFWITHKFNQPEQFTFVELSLEDKKNVV